MRLCLDQDWDDLTCTYREWYVSNDSKQAGHLTRVRGKAQDGFLVGREDVVKQHFRTIVLRARCLACNAGPQRVGLCEVVLKAVIRKSRGDGGAIGSAIACMDADPFTKEFLYRWIKGIRKVAVSELHRL